MSNDTNPTPDPGADDDYQKLVAVNDPLSKAIAELDQAATAAELVDMPSAKAIRRINNQLRRIKQPVAAAIGVTVLSRVRLAPPKEARP